MQDNFPIFHRTKKKIRNSNTPFHTHLLHTHTHILRDLTPLDPSRMRRIKSLRHSINRSTIEDSRIHPSSATTIQHLFHSSLTTEYPTNYITNMKFSAAALLAILGSSNAFVLPNNNNNARYVCTAREVSDVCELT